MLCIHIKGFERYKFGSGTSYEISHSILSSKVLFLFFMMIFYEQKYSSNHFRTYRITYFDNKTKQNIPNEVLSSNNLVYYVEIFFVCISSTNSLLLQFYLVTRNNIFISSHRAHYFEDYKSLYLIL